MTYLKKFDEAISEFEKAKQIDPKQVNSINGKNLKLIKSKVIYLELNFRLSFKEYIKEVERCRNTDNQEKSTKAFLENQKEPNNIENILNKINKTEQPVIYYAGGLRSLSLILTDGKYKLEFI